MDPRVDAVSTVVARPVVRGLAAALLTLVAGVVALMVLWPSSPIGHSLSTAPVLAHALAFPVVLGGGCLVLAAVAYARLERSERALDRAGGVVPVVVNVVVGLALLWQPMMLMSSASPPTKQTMTVLSWNTANLLAPADLADLVDRFDPDVLVLPETGAVDLVSAIRALPGEGLHWSSFTSPQHGDNTPTSVLVHERLGAYRMVPGITTTSGAVTLEPQNDDSLPLIVGLHAAPPAPGLLAKWRADVDVAARTARCDTTIGPPTIVAGDFNATLRHAALAVRTSCMDALEAVGKMHVGTWPSNLPAWVGSPIDHILLHGGLSVEAGEVVRLGDSDHRAVVARIGLD